MMAWGLYRSSCHPPGVPQFPAECVKGLTCSPRWLTSTSECIFFVQLIDEWFCWLAVVLVSVLTWSLLFLTEVWPRSFPNGPALSQCYSGGLATRLSRYQNLGHVGETDFSGCRRQLWPQTYQHHEVSPESSLSWSCISPSGQYFSLTR